MSARGELAPDVLLEALPQLLSAGPPPPPHVIPRFFNAVLIWRPAPGATLQTTSTIETQTAKLRALSALATASNAQVRVEQHAPASHSLSHSTSYALRKPSARLLRSAWTV